MRKVASGGQTTDRLSRLSKLSLDAITKKISADAKNVNGSCLSWFASNVELFVFEGRDGFQLQGYHIPSILSKPLGCYFSAFICITHPVSLSTLIAQVVAILIS